MAASRARWLVTASRTGRGGKAEPALLKWRTLTTPGVSDLSDGTSSVMAASSQARGAWSWDRRSGSRRGEAAPDPLGETRLIYGREARLHHQPRCRRWLRHEMDVRVKHRLVWPARAPLFCRTLYWSISSAMATRLTSEKISASSASSRSCRFGVC